MAQTREDLVLSDGEIHVVGFPCQPFSTQRADRFKPGSVKSHPDYQAFKDTCELILTCNHRAIVAENPEGFMKPYSTEDKSTPYDDMKQAVSHKFRLKAILASPGDIVEAERPRLWLILIDVAAREEVMSIVVEVMKALHAGQANCPRFPLHRVLANSAAPSGATRQLRPQRTGDRKWEKDTQAYLKALPADLQNKSGVHEFFPGVNMPPMQEREAALLNAAILTEVARGNQHRLGNLVVDISQSLSQKPWSFEMKTFCSKSLPLHVSTGKFIKPGHALMIYGQPALAAGAKPESVSESTWKKAVGSTMALQSVGLIVLSVLIGAAELFPGLWRKTDAFDRTACHPKSHSLILNPRWQDEVQVAHWTQALLHAARPMLMNLGGPPIRDVVISTSCSGLHAPGLALQALGFPHKELFAVDPNVCSILHRELLHQLGILPKPQHHFFVIRDLLSADGRGKAECAICRKTCTWSRGKARST